MPFFALIKKEIRRFSTMWIQTIVGPMSTALLYQLIFGHQLASVPTGIDGISYPQFLIPGLVMMQLLLNSFGNGSSSLIQSKYTGNLIFILMAPISPFAMYCAYLISSIVRGLAVGLAVYVCIAWFGGLMLPKAWWAICYFSILGAAIAAGLGIIAGILCDKFDQLAGFQSFIIVPLIYLAGIFFNVNKFSGIWQHIAALDPFLYIVDGFRYGFIAHADANIVVGSIFVLLLAFLINGLGYYLLKNGVKIKS